MTDRTRRKLAVLAAETLLQFEIDRFGGTPGDFREAHERRAARVREVVAAVQLTPEESFEIRQGLDVEGAAQEFAKGGEAA